MGTPTSLWTGTKGHHEASVSQSLPCSVSILLLDHHWETLLPLLTVTVITTLEVASSPPLLLLGSSVSVFIRDSGPVEVMQKDVVMTIPVRRIVIAWSAA